MDSDHVLIDFTLVAARLGFLAGERTGPTADSASDHSSVEIEIVGFLGRIYVLYTDVELHGEEGRRKSS